jgi:hypothetical protein
MEIVMFDNSWKVLAILLMGKCLSGGCAVERNEYPIAADVSYKSRYVAKDGSVLSDGPVIQPHVNAGYGGFAFDLWGNYDTDKDELNELDITLDHSWPLSDDLSASAGYTYFDYPTGFFRETQEFYAGMAYNGAFDASLFAIHDFVDGDGTLILSKIGKELDYQEIKLYPNMVLGQNFGYFQDDSGLSHLGLGVDLDIPLSSECSVVPFVYQQIGLDDNFEDITVGGFRLSHEF